MSEQNLEFWVTETLRMEGGAKFTNRKTDRGGATKYGITHGALATWRGVEKVEPEEVAQLTEEEAREIYKVNYWGAVNGNKLPGGIDFAVAQISVLSGVGTAAKMLQEVAREGDKTLKIDGRVGEKTIAAVRAMRPLDVLFKLGRKWLIHAVKIPGEVNDEGWVNRGFEGMEIAETLLEKRPMLKDAVNSKIITTNVPVALGGTGVIGLVLKEYGPQIMDWVKAKLEDPATIDQLQSGVQYLGQNSNAMNIIVMLTVSLIASVGTNFASAWWRNKMWRKGEVKQS